MIGQFLQQDLHNDMIPPRLGFSQQPQRRSCFIRFTDTLERPVTVQLEQLSKAFGQGRIGQQILSKNAPQLL